jgi:hypothetical protein
MDCVFQALLVDPGGIEGKVVIAQLVRPLDRLLGGVRNIAPGRPRRQGCDGKKSKNALCLALHVSPWRAGPWSAGTCGTYLVFCPDLVAFGPT